MVTITDILVAVTLLSFFISGWNKGIIKAVIGPLSTLLCIAAVYVFFNKIQSPFLCLLILILGPIVLSLTFSLMLTLWSKTVAGNDAPLLVSRILGGIFTGAWGWGMLIFVLIFIGMMPTKVFKFKKLQEDISSSVSYAYVQGNIVNKIPQVKSTANLLEVFQDPDKIAEIQDTPGYEEIYNHKKIQALINDEEIVKLVKEKNVIKLLANPKVMAIWQDEKLIMKFLEVSQKSMGMPHPKPAAEQQVYEFSP